MVFRQLSNPVRKTKGFREELFHQEKTFTSITKESRLRHRDLGRHEV